MFLIQLDLTFNIVRIARGVSLPRLVKSMGQRKRDIKGMDNIRNYNENKIITRLQCVCLRCVSWERIHILDCLNV